VSTRRMGFDETPDLLSRIGFQARLLTEFDHAARRVIVRAGSLVFGFARDGDASHGFVIDGDMAFPPPAAGGDAVFYLTMAVDGSLRMDVGNFDSVRGIGANVPGIPWYTFNGRALIGKVFMESGFFRMAVACDDAFWCEFEGGF